MKSVKEILEEREAVYGSYAVQCKIYDDLVKALGPKLDDCMEPHQTHSLRMICTKLARIMNGDSDYVDSWRDIAGYAELTAMELERAAERAASSADNEFPF